MNELLTKADLAIFEVEVVTAIRRSARRFLWLGTAGTAVVNGLLLAALLTLT
jgi:hypothetical protein